MSFRSILLTEGIATNDIQAAQVEALAIDTSLQGMHASWATWTALVFYPRSYEIRRPDVFPLPVDRGPKSGVSGEYVTLRVETLAKIKPEGAITVHGSRKHVVWRGAYLQSPKHGEA
ncbi:hypothetical protein DL771_005395 [Monosporascus sp. 5C6A]|nr:hypothetical protein DL771_005395 [Monosporascus sp. 5C6A]